MERTHVELPARFFPGGRIRIWSQPVRSTILLECLDKNRRFNRDVRNELQQRWNREVLEQLTRGYKCQSSGNTMYLDIPTKVIILKCSKCKTDYTLYPNGQIIYEAHDEIIYRTQG